MRVQLYRNLKTRFRKQQAWLLRIAEGPKKGANLDNVDGAVLQNTEFYVSEKIRQYVIAQGRRFVHAWIEGDLVKTYALNTLPVDTDGNDIAPGLGVTSRIGYNPYKNRLMVREDCQEYVTAAPLIVATPSGVYAHFDEACTGRGLRGLRGLGAVDWTGPTDIDGWNG